MAHTHNIQKYQRVSTLDSIGDKVKKAAEIAGTIKGIWDTGKLIYQTVSPVIGPAIAAAGML